MNYPTYFAVISFAWVAVSAVIAFPVQSQVPGDQSPDIRLFAERDLERLQRQIEDEPDNHLIRRQYADALYEAKRFKEAAYHYEIFLQHFQGAPDTIHRYLIAIAGYHGDNEKGERATTKYLTYYPSDHELYRRLGYFRLWQGKYGEALEAFNRAIQLRPDDFESQKGAIEARAAINLNNRLTRSIPANVSDSSLYPQIDEKRFRFINELMQYERFSSAYEELMLLADRHDHTRRWLALYFQIDKALVEAVGETPAYPIDRYSYLLKLQPDNIELRYALVEELISKNRIGEAYEVLLVPDHVDPLDSTYARLLKRLDDKRDNWLPDQIDELSRKHNEDPEEESHIRELIDLYLIARRLDETIPLIEKWVALDPANHKVRLRYARALFEMGFYYKALEEVEYLLDKEPSNSEFLRLLTRLVIATNGPADRALKLLFNVLQEYPEDVDALLDISELYLFDNQPQRADTMLRKAYTLGLPEDRARLRSLDNRIERSLLETEKRSQNRILEEARQLSAEGSHSLAIDRFESYLDQKGIRTQKSLLELAQMHSLSGDYLMALSILYELLEKGASPDILKEIARNRYYLRDHAGAIMEMEAYIELFPRDAEARDLLQQMYLETQHFALADSVSKPMQDASDNSQLTASYRNRVQEHIRLIERSISTDYVGLIVPVSRYIRAKGSITSYEHWAQGLLTQITMPAEPRPFVLTAGLVSHFISGTRRLIPGGAITLSRTNQVLVGSYFDLTEPDPVSTVGYTNRIRLELGVFDYSGGRTSSFADIHFLRHVPGRYSAYLRARSTEGGIALWSPAGGEFGLRLTQFEAGLSSIDILPDSSLRVKADADFNLVKGIPDSTLVGRRNNKGTDIRFELSYQIFNHTYLGLSFNTVDYRHTLETYFSPSRYRAYDIWLEYENELVGKWYFRSRITTGLAFYRRGAFAARAEADLIYRFAPQFSFSINGSAGHSVRFIDGEESLRDERFRMALLSAAFYWTL